MGEPRFDCHVGLVVPDEIRQEHLDRRDAERIYNSGVRKRLEGILRKPGKTDPRVQAKYDA